MSDPSAPRRESGSGPVSLASTCFVSPKSTGIVSLIIQFALLVISSLTVIFFFYHVGGYEYMGWNENSTILEPVYHRVSAHPDEFTIRPARSTMSPYDMDDLSNLLNDTMPEPQFFNDDDSIIGPTKNVTTLEILNLDIEQVPNTTIHISLLETDLDMLELIRISTLLYLGLNALWCASLVLLMLSIKFEVLDLIITNAIFLTIACMYALIHALFIAVLLYYQRNLTWRTMSIVIGSVAILVMTTFLGAFSLALVVGWYRYVVYMYDTTKCFCITGLVGAIKGRKRRTPEDAAAGYAMPEATRHAEIPETNNPPVDKFSQF